MNKRKTLEQNPAQLFFNAKNGIVVSKEDIKM